MADLLYELYGVVALNGLVVLAIGRADKS